MKHLISRARPRPHLSRPKKRHVSVNRDKDWTCTISFRDRCRRNDERHVEILEYIAEHDTNTGFRLTAIRDLFDRGHGRPNQPLEGSGPGGSIPFQVVLPVAIHNDEDEG